MNGNHQNLTITKRMKNDAQVLFIITLIYAITYKNIVNLELKSIVLLYLCSYLYYITRNNFLILSTLQNKKILSYSQLAYDYTIDKRKFPYCINQNT
jgi:hypothetical protein